MKPLERINELENKIASRDKMIKYLQEELKKRGEEIYILKQAIEHYKEG
jgi:peptidoglycan hydrolase CwlO-like protein